MIDSCDPERTISANKKKAIFKQFIGAILHDYHIMEQIPWCDKWMEFISCAYNTMRPKEISAMLDVGSLRATNASRISGIANNVERYLAGDFIPDAGSDAESVESDSE
jgi:hypothetical protein